MQGQLLSVEARITDNLVQLLQVLPPDVRLAIQSRLKEEELLEIVLDLGRQPEARFTGGSAFLTERLVDQNDIEYVTSRVGEFGKDNRAGIERTLHRISAIRNRTGRIIGLTCRIGRAVFGTIDIMRDVIESGKNVLMLGRPGVGKTTKLREVARVLGEEFNKRVVIVDTSNEIAGDGDIPHPAIGRARRMQVPEPSFQHAVMIEAVENHMPEVIIIDEIGTELETTAARTIAERGVQLIGTAHGNTLENLLMNPTLSDLIGGIQTVTLGDEEARRRGTQKTVLERKAPPTFDVVIEIMEKEKLAVHHDVATTIDNLLRGKPPRPEIRERSVEGDIRVIQTADDLTFAPTLREERAAVTGYGMPDYSERYRTDVEVASPRSSSRPVSGRRGGNAPGEMPASLRIFPYGVSRSRLDKAIRDLKVAASIAKTWNEADAVVALKAHFRREPGRLKDAINDNKPTFVVRSNTQVQIEAIVREMFGMAGDSDEVIALREAEEGIQRVMDSGEPVELMPQNAYVRRLQHQLITAHNLSSSSVGTEPRRRIRITKD